MDILNEIKSLLSNWDDNLISKLTGNPIIFQIERNNQLLYYFGSIHTFDPNHSQFNQLKLFFDEFLSRANNNKSVIMVEGGLRAIEKTEKESIINQGEAGFISYLSANKNLKILSPEPKRIDEMADLENKYSKDEIQYYYFARVVNQWNRMNPKSNFENYINHFLEMDKKESGWNDYDFSLDNMIDIHKKLFNSDFNENDSKFYYDAINPTELNYVTNNYARDMGINRDAFIVKNIVEEWEKGNNIFIVYGCGHALTQRRALESLLK